MTKTSKPYIKKLWTTYTLLQDSTDDFAGEEKGEEKASDKKTDVTDNVTDNGC